MEIVDTYPRSVRDIENIWIPLADGTRLAARMWLPEDAEADPVPAIIEYIPYRKRDSTRERDEEMYPWFAGHGYACLRIDMRGSGDSEGLLYDEYTVQEQDDCVEAIAWIAAQSWCTGRVGMMGKSWSGFNSLQVAARRPPALAAVIAIHASDDRYGDDVHYRGGCMLSDNGEWAAMMQGALVLPPDPEIVGERWRDMWSERLASLPFLAEPWVTHQTHDDYWKQGSVDEDYSAITCAVYAIGGWADSYSNTPFRLAANLSSPWKVLAGPWGHQYLHQGVPGPAIGFLQECRRWWDHWLKGVENGVMDEPRIRIWVHDSAPPRTHYDERPGRWVAEEEWPSPHLVPTPMLLDPRGLVNGAASTAELTVGSPQTTGMHGGRFCGFGYPGDTAGDQRADDAMSLVFDSAPLDERLEIVGAASIELDVAADQPSAFVVARLCDVAPDGASTKVTWGLLNLTHRHSHAAPEPVRPGERMRVTVDLDDIGYAFPAGHRIRLSLSSAYWPTVWPSPAPVTLTVFTGESRLLLPAREPRATDAQLPAFEAPLRARGAAVTPLAEGRSGFTIFTDLATGETTYRVFAEGDADSGAGVIHLDDIDLDLYEWPELTYTIRPDDPLSACATSRLVCGLRRGDWHVRVDASVCMRATQEEFVVDGVVDAFEGDRCVSHREWSVAVPRNGV